MGARNIAAAYAMWGHLEHGPFRLLVGMALISLDNPTKEGRPARVYFGGEQGMVDLYGRDGRAVYNALAALRNAGAIEVIEKGRNGHRAVYRLNLNPFPGGDEGSGDVTHEPGTASRDVTLKPHLSGAEASREPSRSLTQAAGLGTTRGTTRRSPQEETSRPQVPHQGAVASLPETA